MKQAGKMRKDMTGNAICSKKGGKRNLMPETRILTLISRWIIPTLFWREIRKAW
jgi:hypothetical protein